MKKKILIMQPSLCMGGVERVLLTLLKNINMEKYDITLLLRNRGIWDDEIPKNVKVRYLFIKDPSKQGPFVARLYKYGVILTPSMILQKYLNLGQHDIYIAFHEPMMYFLRGVKGRKIAWIHSDYSVVKHFPEVNQLANKNGVLARLINKVRIKTFQQCDNVVCVAESAMKGIIYKAEIQPQNVIYKYNLNNEDEIRELSNEEVPAMQVEDDFINICSVGRLADQKAFERFIYVVSNLKSDGYRIRLFIVGDGPHREKLQSLISINGLDDHIKLVGYDKNPYKYISKSKFFVCSSLYEAFCTATTESIILGVPVITTDCSGMSELFGSSKSGLIVKNDEVSLYQGIKRVLDNEELYLKMKESAIIRGKEFEREPLISEIERLFDE